MALSREEMRERTDAFYSVMNDHDVKGVTSLLADDVVDHQLPPEMPNGREGAGAFFTMMFDSAPDMRFEILDVLISEDKAAIRSRVTGTQSGPFLEMPATGKPFDVEGIDIVRVNDEGLVTEHWGIFDFAKMMQQVGLAPGG